MRSGKGRGGNRIKRKKKKNKGEGQQGEQDKAYYRLKPEFLEERTKLLDAKKKKALLPGRTGKPPERE